MTTTITRTGDSADTVPEAVLTYATTNEARSIVTDLIDGSIAVTLVPPRPRSGTLNLFYLSESEAWSAQELLRAADSFTLVDTDFADLLMTFVVVGMTLTLDPQSRQAWLLDVDYQEIEL